MQRSNTWNNKIEKLLNIKKDTKSQIDKTFKRVTWNENHTYLYNSNTSKPKIFKF